MKFKDMNDKELMYWYNLAQEMRDGNYIEAIKQELSRRNKDE